MSDLLRLSPAMVRAAGFIEAPGFLRGRQRSPEFKDRVYRAVEHVLRLFTRWDVNFPLCLRETSKLLRMTKRQFEGVLEMVQAIGLVDPVRAEAVRRVHDGTKSPTPGSNGAWFCPGLYRLGMAFRDLFPDFKGLGSELADLPLENQYGTERLTTVSIYRGNGSEIFFDEAEPKLALRPGSTEPIDDDASIDAVKDGLEDALETFRRRRAPEAMPDHRGRPGAPERPVDDAAFEAALRAHLDAQYGRSTLSAEALRKFERDG